MLLATTTSMPRPDRVATQRLFNDLALDMTRNDAKLEEFVRRGLRVGEGWDTWFNETATTLSSARDAYLQLNPQDAELGARLASDVIDLAKFGGRIGAWHEDGRTFGRGWESRLDGAIATAQEAANRLYTAPNPGTPDGGVVDAAKAAETLAARSLEMIRRLPLDDRGHDYTKQARIDAFEVNLHAQQLIEPHFGTPDERVASTLRRADAYLEDANWQLAKKPSPDGRFNGVDIPGALRDTASALETLRELTHAAG